MERLALFGVKPVRAAISAAGQGENNGAANCAINVENCASLRCGRNDGIAWFEVSKSTIIDAV